MVSASFVKALEETEEIELTVTARASGRTTSRPVWFVHEGRRLDLLPVKGSDTAWYRNVDATPTITIRAGKESWTGNAMPITEADRVREVVEKFRAKYGPGEIKKYYSKLDVAVEVPLA